MCNSIIFYQYLITYYCLFNVTKAS